MFKRSVVLAAGAFVVVAMSWCGPPVKACQGCTSGSQCIETRSNAQCGRDGNVCVACTGAALCVAGTCVGEMVVDAGLPDAALDAGVEDAGQLDAGIDSGVDAGLDDAGTADAGDDAGVPDAGTDAGTFDGGPTQRIRVMAANLTAGNNQNYNVPPGDVAPGPGPRIILGAHPDVVMLQELRFGSDDDAGMQTFADLLLGPGAYWCREVIDSAGDLPNGIFSRFPILGCGEWQDSRVTNRDYAWAHLDVPGPRDLWAISVHLHTTAASRPIEGAELRANVLNNLPAGDFVVLGGDLNTDSSDPLVEPIFDALDDVFVVQPQPSDQFGNPATNTNRLIRLADGGADPMRNKPYDWVMANPALTAREVPVVLTDGVTTYTLPHGFIIDTRVFDAGTIGLIAPAQLGDSAALNMQHMGVVRDFDLPL